MLETVLVFALITAIFELVILMKFASLNTLRKPWMQWACHVLAFIANLTIHWGTIVGTMTAVTAGLVSFITVPLAIMLMTYMMHYRQRQAS